MTNFFVNCNSKTRFDDFTYMPFEITEECYLRQLKESLESDIVPFPELDVFVKEGYGALVGGCPLECETLEQLFQYNPNLSLIERLKNTLTGKKNKSVFGYEDYVKEGADLVIGPGCTANGIHYNKAVYCRNYKEMVAKINAQNETKGLSK